VLASTHMRAVLEGERADSPRDAPFVPSLSPSLLAAAALVLTGAAVLVGGGTSDGPVAWIGMAAVSVAAAGLAAVLVGRLRPPQLGRTGLLSVGLLAGLVIWSGASVVWSIWPDRSWNYANRGLTYLAFLVLGLLLAGALRRAPALAAYALAGLVAIAVAWALAGKIAPALFPDGARIARLREPVGFWNALALLCAMGVPVALWIAASRRHAHALRAAAVLLLYALAVGAVLTLSRGGAIVAVLAAGTWLLLGSPRLESLAALALAGPFALGVAAWALEQPGLTSDFQSYDARFRAGWQFGLVLGLAGAALWLLAFFASRAESARPLPEARRRTLVRALLFALAVLCGLALVAGAVKAGNPVGWAERQIDEFTRPAEASQDPNRFRSVSSYRWVWWQEAWQAFEDDPLQGSGAGSFELTHRRLRANDLTVQEPHSLPLQFLSETGIVGFLLFGGTFAAAVAGGASRLRRAEGAERPAVAALLIVLGAYLVHSLLEWSWEFVALNAPLFLLVGVLLGRPGGAPGPRRRLWALGTAVLALAFVYVLAAPRIADDRVDKAYAAIDRGDLERAIEWADEARAFNAVALGPLFARASAYDLLGIQVEATHTLYAAVRLQPKNPDAWYELGVFELRVTRKLNNAFNHLDNAYELDPSGPAGGPLDEVRQIFFEEKQKCFAAGTC